MIIRQARAADIPALVERRMQLFCEVDNRYGRAGVFMLLSPIYSLAVTADWFVFNTIEFWTGKNPITGKSRLWWV